VRQRRKLPIYGPSDVRNVSRAIKVSLFLMGMVRRVEEIAFFDYPNKARPKPGDKLY
jgi:hypothetical protein